MATVAIGPRRRRRRLCPATPLTYAAALAIVAVTVLPLLFVVLGGFRTTAQLNISPTGLPHPWVWSNYRTVITSGSF
jgi:raffinose/stachyose/melibiose transport system permease protein